MLASILALAIFGAVPVAAERHHDGDLIVVLDGDIVPATLPRDELAPATVTVSSRLEMTDSSVPPRVRRIALEFAGGAVSFSRRGLAICPGRRLSHATSAQALDRCGPALVGHGRLEALLLLPHQRRLRIRARLLDFNARSRNGGPAILVHAYSSRPPVSFVLPFELRREGAGAPSSLSAAMPRSAGRWTHLAAFRMTLGRRYNAAGNRRSYLSASCPAPPRFTAGFFSIAHITYSLAGRRRIGESIVRGCHVRG